MRHHSVFSTYKSPRKTTLVGALLIATALAVTGCASKKNRSSSTHALAATQPASEAEIYSALDHWGKRYEADNSDKEAAITYALLLRRIGQPGQAVSVLQKAIRANPKDVELKSAYGKALASDGKFKQALTVIRQAQRRDRPDWKLLSAEAALVDQLGNRNEARRLYQQALTIAPDEPSILSNLGLSYVLSGDPKTAESYLRRAANRPNADSRVRQNLALVVGLQGRFDEAEKIATNELSPQQARANVTYLRRMLSQSSSWNRLKKSGKKRS